MANTDQPITITRWRKKPVEVEAQQATAETLHQVFLWVAGYVGTYDCTAADKPTHGVSIDPDGGVMVIATLEGEMRVSPGDWVIRGVQGEFYPCKPDIFAATYEPATDADPMIEVTLTRLETSALVAHTFARWLREHDLPWVDWEVVPQLSEAAYKAFADRAEQFADQLAGRCDDIVRWTVEVAATQGETIDPAALVSRAS